MPAAAPLPCPFSGSVPPIRTASGGREDLTEPRGDPMTGSGRADQKSKTAGQGAKKGEGRDPRRARGAHPRRTAPIYTQGIFARQTGRRTRAEIAQAAPLPCPLLAPAPRSGRPAAAREDPRGRTAHPAQELRPAPGWDPGRADQSENPRRRLAFSGTFPEPAHGSGCP